MKKLLGLLLVISSIEASSQVPNVDIKDSTFLRAIDIFLDSVSNLKVKDKVIVLVTIEKLEWRRIELSINDPEHVSAYRTKNELNYELTLSLQRDLGIFTGDYLPSFAFDHRNRKCFVRFSIEDIFAISEIDRRAIVRQASKYFESFDGSSVLAGMIITVHGPNLTVGPFGH